MLRFMSAIKNPMSGGTRTTVRLSGEVMVAAKHLQADRGLSLSEAVNELAQAGLNRRQSVREVVLPEFDYEPKVDVTNIGELLGIEEEAHWQDRDDR